MLKNKLDGDKDIISMGHATGKIFGNWFKVSEHFVRALVAKQSDDVSIDISHKESYGSSSVE